MEELKLHCHGCGGSFSRDELQYRPSGRGAYRRDFYFCPVWNEKEKQKIALSAAASSFRKTLPSRPGHLAHKRW